MQTMSSFYNDRVFETREELMDWVQTTARNLGYVIVIQRTKKTVLGFVKNVYLMCDRGGEYKSASQSTTLSGTKKCGCPFQLIAKYSHDPTHSGWKINVICDIHNHDPAIFLEGHAFAKRLSKKEFEIVEDMTKKHMAPRDILTQLKKNDDQNVSTRQIVYDARKKIHQAERVGQTPMQLMVECLHTGGYIYHIRQEPDSNQVQDLFFINPISMKMWRAFPHVLILDPTYKTNRYHLPFLEIVGLTSTNKTFCIAFAFIRNEKIDNFKWVLHCLIQTLEDYMLPRVIVTDRDLALMEACRYVFPKASRILCRYHIFENIRKHHRPSFDSQTDWDKFTSWWNRVINSPTIDEYVQNRT
ncbi:hypothetical protein OROGR_011429 [Orobanche gracilis]